MQTIFAELIEASATGIFIGQASLHVSSVRLFVNLTARFSQALDIARCDADNYLLHVQQIRDVMTLSSQTEAHSDVLAVWNSYRDGIYDGDADRLASIFHPSACMFFLKDGQLISTPIENYIEVVRNRTAPRAIDSERRERLLSIAIPSTDSAVVTATILITGRHFTDQLTMMKDGERWLIVSKTYHLDYDSSS